MKPNFEPFVHTVRDLVGRDITLYMGPGAGFWIQWLSKSDIPEYRKIAETMIISKSYDEYDEMIKEELLSQGTHALMQSYMWPYVLVWATEYDHVQGRYKYNSGRGFYRGEKVVGKIPGGGYLTNKKWHLNEVEKPKLSKALYAKVSYQILKHYAI